MSYESREEVKAACVPCAIGHFATSARLLNEAVRFRSEGVASPQVLDDIAAVLGEQNALERIDLTPEKIRRLPEWEQGMAQEALDRSRELRHSLETVKDMDGLMNIAADTEEFYKYLNRNWQSKRITGHAVEELIKIGDEPHAEVSVDTESAKRRRAKFIQDIRRGRRK